MHIEQGFRDFKTDLGVRGLQLQVRISERVERLLMAFTLAYALVVALGVSRLAEEARERLDDRRPAERHRTGCILSARTVAALPLGYLCAKLLARLAATIEHLPTRTLAARGLYHIARHPLSSRALTRAPCRWARASALDPPSPTPAVRITALPSRLSLTSPAPSPPTASSPIARSTLTLSAVPPTHQPPLPARKTGWWQRSIPLQGGRTQETIGWRRCTPTSAHDQRNT